LHPDGNLGLQSGLQGLQTGLLGLQSKYQCTLPGSNFTPRGASERLLQDLARKYLKLRGLAAWFYFSREHGW
jgi:hypothetical protein